MSTQAGATRWDVVVVGAGVAGGLAALDCARRGLRVLLVEKRSFPRWKVCGCCFNNQAQAVLAAVGQQELIADRGGLPLHRLRLGLNGVEATVGLPGGQVLSRERFDQALAEAAAAAGASVRFQTSAAIEASERGWRTVRLTPSNGRAASRVQARVVLIAAGLVHHVVPDQEGCQPWVAPRSRVGAGCVLRARTAGYEPGTIHMAIGSGGYVGLVRREDGELNLAAALDRSAVAEAGGAAGAVRAVLHQAGFAALQGIDSARWQLTPPLTRRNGRLAGDRFLVLGDAAGYVEPFTGEGMAWALTAGAAAAPFVLEGLQHWSPDLERRWQQRMRRSLIRRQRMCRSLAWLLRRPAPTSAVFALVRRWPHIPERIVSGLNRVSLPPMGPTSCP
ncbi:NAD(P)/FAD-dependent oxidoreductase [Synechococcus sp. RSCCF101]|uniref:NAD(P)/FAD-dependent oxidoreductase n=1 Tax=Synechococcus sp. RSCCF101 TaxID=2511069 RepID=UPI001CD947B1|nr:FAD-dependent oxidoreductase [Synechococcus sp. RSCCF101]